MNETRSTRPAPVRIADLVAPEYPEEIAAAFEMAAPMADMLQFYVDRFGVETEGAK